MLYEFDRYILDSIIISLSTLQLAIPDSLSILDLKNIGMGTFHLPSSPSNLSNTTYPKKEKKRKEKKREPTPTPPPPPPPLILFKSNSLSTNALMISLFPLNSTNTYGDAAGFLAADTTQQQIILSFRGSRTTSNWIANLDTELTSSTLCSGCEVHQGFWLDYQTVAATLKAQIDAALNTYPGYSLVVTGHSLGGALAMLAGLDLNSQGYAPTIVRLSLSLSLFSF